MSAHNIFIHANFAKCISVYDVYGEILEIFSSFCCIKISRNVKEINRCLHCL